MPVITIKSHDYNIFLTRDSFTRRAIQYANSIFEKFRKLGLTKDDVEVSEERVVIKRAPASVSWWINDQQCIFTYNKFNKFVDNLLVVLKVIDRHIIMVLGGEMSIGEFVEIFQEHGDVEKKRTKAREFFGLDENHVDFESVTKQYKLFAKDLHPDMPNGDINKFKELNEHHKVLKRELE